MAVRGRTQANRIQEVAVAALAQLEAQPLETTEGRAALVLHPA
jgi:hypothetical protein